MRATSSSSAPANGHHGQAAETLSTGAAAELSVGALDDRFADEHGAPSRAVLLLGGFHRTMDHCEADPDAAGNLAQRWALGAAAKVEAFAIEAINALRLAHGREPLTNAVKGHGVAIEPLAQYESRMHTERVEVSDRNGKGQLAILVSADLDDSGNAEYQVGDAADLPTELHNLAGRVNWMEWAADLPARRAWDVHMPWNNEEACERARRFWKLGANNVRAWIERPATAPTHLLLGVKESQRSPTTIRYAWHIDPNGTWECYAGSTVGVPLGDADHEHSLLNTIPVIDDQGAMRGNAGGHKLIRYES